MYAITSRLGGVVGGAPTAQTKKRSQKSREIKQCSGPSSRACSAKGARAALSSESLSAAS